jgi:hypothetical protein
MLFLCGLPVVASAQGRSKPPVGRIPVRVSLVDEFPFNADRAVILRHDPKRESDVIVLPLRTATAEQLAEAGMTLAVLMAKDGDHVDKDALFRVSAMKDIPRNELAAATHLLDKIRTSTPVVEGSLGMARTGLMYLPSRATRDKDAANGRLTIKPQP